MLYSSTYINLLSGMEEGLSYIYRNTSMAYSAFINQSGENTLTSGGEMMRWLSLDSTWFLTPSITKMPDAPHHHSPALRFWLQLMYEWHCDHRNYGLSTLTITTSFPIAWALTGSCPFPSTQCRKRRPARARALPDAADAKPGGDDTTLKIIKYILILILLN